MRSDLTGQRFGRLVVETGVSIKRSGKTRMLWTCLCDCGTRLTVISDNLKSGHTKSCGCLRIETGREVGKKVKHGASTESTTTWCYARLVLSITPLLSTVQLVERFVLT